MSSYSSHINNNKYAEGAIHNHLESGGGSTVHMVAVTSPGSASTPRRTPAVFEKSMEKQAYPPFIPNNEPRIESPPMLEVQAPSPPMTHLTLEQQLDEYLADSQAGKNPVLASHLAPLLTQRFLAGAQPPQNPAPIPIQSQASSSGSATTMETQLGSAPPNQQNASWATGDGFLRVPNAAPRQGRVLPPPRPQPDPMQSRVSSSESGTTTQTRSESAAPNERNSGGGIGFAMNPQSGPEPVPEPITGTMPVVDYVQTRARRRWYHKLVPCVGAPNFDV